MEKPRNSKIDSHQHFWEYDPVKLSWIDDSLNLLRKDFTPEDLEPHLRKNGFEGCIAVQAQQNKEETRFLLNLAEKYVLIKGVVGWVNLNSPEAPEDLQKFSENPWLKGVRHTVFDEKGEFMKDPDFHVGIEKLQEFNLTYDILAFDYQLPGAVELVKKFPEQPFVLDHMGKPQITKGVSSEWMRNIQELASFPNVFCKLSGLVTETKNFHWQKDDFQPFLDVVLKAFGEKRLMYGSDWPVCLVAASYEETLDIIKAHFADSPSAEENIFGRNASHFYNLE